MNPVIPYLNAQLEAHKEALEDWFTRAFTETPPLFYNSVDIRHSGHKLAPVDTNLFPAGFNNLPEVARKKAVEAAREVLLQRCPKAKTLLLLPENHTRNRWYLENLFVLQTILQQAGYSVHLGSIDPELTAPVTLETAMGNSVHLRPARRVDDRLLVEGIDDVPCMVIVNNDFSGSSPDILVGLKQPVLPPVGMGWYRRRKSVHFEAYDQLVRECCEVLGGVDPWLLSTLHRRCGRIDFKSRQGLECVALNVEKVVHSLRAKYAEYGITDTPYVFVKADSGTYGMGMMTVSSGEEVLEMNKKRRHSMHTVKEGTQNTEVIIQEGVPTVDRVEGAVAEPMLYVVGGQVVGGALRLHEEKDATSSLNAPGMRFEPLRECEKASGGPEGNLPSAHCRVYGLVARLTALAAAREVYVMDGSYSI